VRSGALTPALSHGEREKTRPCSGENRCRYSLSHGEREKTSPCSGENRCRYSLSLGEREKTRPCSGENRCRYSLSLGERVRVRGKCARWCPHPGPLPWGEGEDKPLAQGRTGADIPSPFGRGLG